MPVDLVTYFVDSDSQLCDLPRGVKAFRPLSITTALWVAWKEKRQVAAWSLVLVQPQPDYGIARGNSIVAL